MNNQFTMLLLGPAGSGKSSFISSFSDINIFPYITAKTLGGANTTKLVASYEFVQNCDEFSVVECTAKNSQNQDAMESDLQQLASQANGIEKVFDKINDPEFAQECLSITLRLPGKACLFPQESKIDTIIIRDSRGFGDIDFDKSFDMDRSGITDDVNTILFFSISSIQQPTVFGKIIDEVMKTNLKTPMFLLRRDPDLTQNDQDFKDKILDNLSHNDRDLKEVVVELSQTSNKYRLNPLVFELPEVKKWKGALDVDHKGHLIQKQDYENAAKEILGYAIDMYESLNQLLSDQALQIVTSLVTNPNCKPYNDIKSRDTKAFTYPARLYDPKRREARPFVNEISKRGNQHADGVIPHYSYSCVNFRNIFPEIVDCLLANTSPQLMDLNPLFQTFMDIVLEPYTITTFTGYSFSNCRKDAFKFYLMTDARDKASQHLDKYKLIHKQEDIQEQIHRQ